MIGMKRQIQSLDEVIRKHTLETLKFLDGNRTLTARALGKSIRWLRNHLGYWRDEGFEIPECKHWGRPKKREVFRARR